MIYVICREFYLLVKYRNKGNNRIVGVNNQINQILKLKQ